MWNKEVLIKEIDDYFDNATKESLMKDLESVNCINLVEDISGEDKNNPYLTSINISKEYKYNPHYGDNRICKCGHSYYRHFDSYEDNSPVGCKYCPCGDFVEKVDSK